MSEAGRKIIAAAIWPSRPMRDALQQEPPIEVDNYPLREASFYDKPLTPPDTKERGTWQEAHRRLICSLPITTHVDTRFDRPQRRNGRPGKRTAVEAKALHRLLPSPGVKPRSARRASKVRPPTGKRKG